MKQYTWHDASLRWIKEMEHKRTSGEDCAKLMKIHKIIYNLPIEELTRSVVNLLIEQLKAQDLSNATINRYLALIKAVMNKAKNEWEWTEKVPYIKLLKEPQNRTRWLTEKELERLFCALPIHLVYMVEFALATGQRASNISGLKWTQIDLETKIWTIPASEFKQGRDHHVPLNKKAMNILVLNRHKHPLYVFSHNGSPINQCSSKEWQAALIRAGIKDFRWHDLRHTWASKHIQNGTPLDVLQKLGGWASYEQVLKYAHHDDKQLREAAENV